MCICWCVTYINYKMHGATIKVLGKVFGRDRSVRSIKNSSLQLFLPLSTTFRGSESRRLRRNIEKYKNEYKSCPFGLITALGSTHFLIEKITGGIYWTEDKGVRCAGAHRTATYRCDDTRCCIIQF